MSKPETPKLNVVARAPFEIYYEGEAESVSAVNRVGPFDILPGHADFFSVLNPGEVKIQNGEESQVFKISNGIVTARDDEVMIFVNM